VIELVWDSGRTGTATAASGATVAVGDDARFSPNDLLAAALAGGLMRTFLQLAAEAGQPILSYVATAHAESSVPASPVVVHIYLLAPAGADAKTLANLCARSGQLSPLAQRLAQAPTVTCEVRVLCGSHHASS